MDEYSAVKMRLKNKKRLKVNSGSFQKPNKYINNLITRILISVIVFFGFIIATNGSSKISKFVSDDVLKKNISFSKITNLYNKYFGNVLPFKDITDEANTVFNETLTYESIKNYKDGYQLEVKENYLVPVITSGIVVFIGEKEELGNTVIVQGIDEVDYWYSNIDNLSVSLYDYVSEGAFLGSAKGTNLYLTFLKNGEYLGYDEVLE